MNVYNPLQVLHPNAPMAARKLGVRGLVKSAWHSLRQTARPESILVHPNVIMDLGPTGEFDIEGRLMLGFIGETGVSHPALMKSRFVLQGDGVVTVPGGNARIGPCTVTHVEGEFTMGDSYINSHAKILCEESITIGDDCAIAWDVELCDSDRHPYAIDGEPVPYRAPIEIRDGVWIGSNVIVKKGVTIGEGAVVASGSVVTGDVAPGTLIAGVPAERVADDIERLE